MVSKTIGTAWNSPSFDWRIKPIAYVCFGAAILHCVLLGYDALHPDRFINADRAIDRLETIKGFIETLVRGTGLADFLSTHGNPGDYVIHAAFYGVGGPLLVIVFQCALMIAATVAVFNLAILVSGSPRVGAVSATMFFLLPHNIAFCHVLSSEAVFIPLVAIGSYFCGVAFLRDGRWQPFVWAGLSFGLAALVRPLILLWPLFLCASMLALRLQVKLIAAFLALAMLPMMMWMVFIWTQTGEFSEGKSERDLAHNLFSRVHLATDRLDAAERERVRARFLPPESKKQLSLTGYIAFCAGYPSICFKHLMVDSVAFVSKSGIEKISIEYLDLAGADKRSTENARYDFQDKATGWRHILETKGPMAVLYYFMSRHPVIGLSSALGAIAMLVLWAYAALGARALLSAPGRHDFAIVLMLFPLYLFSVSQFVDQMQSRHRAPGEFVLCIFAAVGWERKRLRFADAATRKASA